MNVKFLNLIVPVGRLIPSCMPDMTNETDGVYPPTMFV